MCGFLVSEKTINKQSFEKSFEKIGYRGPDSKRIINQNGLWGFHRLSIMDLTEKGMQPFIIDENIAVCNGEIYNFEDLEKELDFPFKSHSDCEVLLPLFKKYGVDMFDMLDAEYALVMYDTVLGMVASRDPIGIRPLFYGYHKELKSIMFSSEGKALFDLVDNVIPFPPGHYYCQGKFISYRDITTNVISKDTDIKVVTKKINKLLTTGIEKRLHADAKVGFLLSGGLDSSLVCSIAAKFYDKPIKTFAVGMDTDPIDLKYAREVADFIGSDHHEVIITKEDVLGCVKDLIRILETFDITTIRASIGMYLLVKNIYETTDIKVLLTGEISDELFGYKYTDFAPNGEEFQKESKKRIEELYLYDVLRADRSISSNSIEARVPFGDLAFVKYVMSLNPELKMNTYGHGKYLLRKSFENGYLPENILYRQKAAFSDAVGHSLVDHLKDYTDSYYSDEEFETLKKKYTHVTPISKESLFYREIFEQHYPNHAKLIPAFWMPNKNWENCDVNDPSARVLKNYGDSGK